MDLGNEEKNTKGRGSPTRSFGDDNCYLINQSNQSNHFNQ